MRTAPRAQTRAGLAAAAAVARGGVSPSARPAAPAGAGGGSGLRSLARSVAAPCPCSLRAPCSVALRSAAGAALLPFLPRWRGLPSRRSPSPPAARLRRARLRPRSSARWGSVSAPPRAALSEALSPPRARSRAGAWSLWRVLVGGLARGRKARRRRPCQGSSRALQGARP